MAPASKSGALAAEWARVGADIKINQANDIKRIVVSLFMVIPAIGAREARRESHRRLALNLHFWLNGGATKAC